MMQTLELVRKLLYDKQARSRIKAQMWQAFEECSFFIDKEAGSGGSHHTNVQKPKNSPLSSALPFNGKEMMRRSNV
jgi:hypothetical protein